MKILKGTGIIYTDAFPDFSINSESASEFNINLYDIAVWNPSTMSWMGIELISTDDAALNSTPEGRSPKICIDEQGIIYKYNGDEKSWIPRKVFTTIVGNITQVGTGDPNIEIIYNDTSYSLQSTRTNVGTYIITFDSSFDSHKLYYNISNPNTRMNVDSSTVLKIQTFNNNVISDSILDLTPFEIKFYK